VILFADNLNFRATYFGTSKLFLNALFFSMMLIISFLPKSDKWTGSPEAASR